MSSPVKIFSCCGGGVRSMIPITIIAEVEARTDMASHEIFDYMGGTSAGGMLTLALATPNFEQGSDRPHQWSAKRLLNDHPYQMASIFQASRFSSLTHLSRRKYTTSDRNAAIKEYLGDTLMGEMLTHVAIPSISLSDNHRIVYTKSDTPLMKATDVCEAATAAPTYFETKEMPAEDAENAKVMLDAGLGCNNPVFTTYTRAAKQFGTQRGFTILSIGTGHIRENYIPKTVMDNGGWLSNASKLVNYMGHSNVSYIEDDVDYYLPKSIFKVDVEIEPRHFDLDNADPRNIAELHDLARRWIDEHTDELDTYCHEKLMR